MLTPSDFPTNRVVWSMGFYGYYPRGMVHRILSGGYCPRDIDRRDIVRGILTGGILTGGILTGGILTGGILFWYHTDHRPCGWARDVSTNPHTRSLLNHGRCFVSLHHAIKAHDVHVENVEELRLGNISSALVLFQNCPRVGLQADRVGSDRVGSRFCRILAGRVSTGF